MMNYPMNQSGWMSLAIITIPFVLVGVLYISEKNGVGLLVEKQFGVIWGVVLFSSVNLCRSII